MPVSDELPYQWYDTPNIHLCTVADFDAFLRERNCVVENRVVLAHDRRLPACAQSARANSRSTASGAHERDERRTVRAGGPPMPRAARPGAKRSSTGGC